MIGPSQFEELSLAGLEPVTLAVRETYNGENLPQQYYHRRFLVPKYSFDGTWDMKTTNNRLIVADIVALDSSLPLKSRPSVSKNNGELPKIGTERSLNEKEHRQIRLLQRAGGEDAAIGRTFFQDVPAVYGGVLEQWEALTLQAMSEGIILVTETTNVGTGIRVDFNYPVANLSNAAIIWGNTGYTPVTDLNGLAKKARDNGSPIRLFFMNQNSLDLLLASDEAKNLFANSMGLASGTFSPTLEQINILLRTRWGYALEVIDRTVTYEVNGVQTTLEPWKDGQVVGVNTEIVGSLVYSDVEEYSAQVEGVTYALGENNLVVKQYRLVRPSLKQVTASEAVSMPVLSEIDRMYKLDTTAVAV